MDRRTSLKWVMAVAATSRQSFSFAQTQAPGRSTRKTGYGSDPDLMKAYNAGELWPLTLNAGQRATTAALCDVIIPADAHSASASAVGVVQFIDEWVSAPYPSQSKDRKVVLEGLSWLDDYAMQRLGRAFVGLDDARRHEVCDDICYLPKTKPQLRRGAEFFARFRDLTAAGFYTAAEGRADLQYIGNMPRATFEGPPIEVRRKVGVA